MTALATDSGRKTAARLAGSAVLACQSDDRLVRLVRSGHERAFDAIVQRYRRQLVRYCARILPESRCEDAVQQAFLNAHSALLGADDDVQLKPWLYAITRNAALNMLRQNGWNYEQIPLDFDGVRRPDQIFEQRFELEQTVAALNQLPERQRDALVMREFEGRSYDEIALALGANDGAVRQLLNRARVTLRNAATLLTPPPLLARAVASMPPADGRRTAEVFAGLGAAGVAKAGATAIIAGSLVVGAVNAPLPLKDGNKPAHQKATLTPAAAQAAGKPAAHDTPVVLHPSAPVSHSKPTTHVPAAVPRHSQQHSNSGRSGPSHDTERHGSRERSGGGDDGRTRERSGSDDTTSGSDDRSGTSGGSGSDDGATTLSGGDDSTSSTSSTSGEGTSGTSGTTESGSGTSGSGDPTTSGTSGSSSSGSGSGEPTPSGSSDSADMVEH